MLIHLFLFNLFVMLCCWVLVSYNRRAGLVDVAWSFNIALNVIVAATVMDAAPLNIRLFIGVASGLWFARLTWHLLRRYANETQEDTRYANMRRALGRFEHIGFLLFFVFQSALVMLFSYPMLELLSISAQQWSIAHSIYLAIAAVIILIAFIGETVADQQLYHFKSNPAHQGKTCDQGLWRYSRHPNYFFEWLHWFAYPILGMAVGLYELWIYPVLMWLFLYYITGIPFSEQQALAHRGDDYRDYQRRTSIFIPLPPKK